MRRRPSTTTWIVIYIIIPITPFIFGGLIRLLISFEFSTWSAFNMSDLAICLALLALLVNQSLLRRVRVLDNEDKKRDTVGQAAVFLFLVLYFMVLFALIVSFRVAIQDLSAQMLEKPLHRIELAVLCAMPLVLIYSIFIQRSFRLKASL